MKESRNNKGAVREEREKQGRMKRVKQEERQI